VLRGGLGPCAHEGVSNDGCGMALRVGLLRTRCSSYHLVVVVGAAAMPQWVLHSGGPLGVVVLAPRLLYQRWFTSAVPILARVWSVGGNSGCPCLLCQRCEYCFGLVDVPIRPACKYSRAVTRVDVPIQSGEFGFLFFYFFLPMTSQDRSLVFFFCYINETRIILCGSLKK
jgi:hypothetical protein